MVTKQNIFDRNLWQKNCLRYRGLFSDYSFIYSQVATNILENIEIQNVNFAKVLEINAKDDFFKKYFSNSQYSSIDFNEIVDENNFNFGKQKFDLVISILDLHFINDVKNFLAKIYESLQPNGYFIASFFGDENLPELRKSIYLAEEKIYNAISPRMPPTIDIKTSAQILGQVGFKNPIADLEKIVINYQNPINLLYDLKNMGLGNIMINRSKKFFTKKLLNQLLENYQLFFNESTKSFDATFNIITISGQKK